MGTDARKLVYDGYSASNVLACDLRQNYLDEGYELYRDAETSSIRFFTSDVFDVPVRPVVPSKTIPLPEITALGELQGRVTHMYTALLFHLFDEESQYAVAVRVATLLKRESGTILFGRHQGAENAYLNKEDFFRYVLLSSASLWGFLFSQCKFFVSSNRYIHSPESWKNLWVKVFTELEGAEFADNRVTVEAELKETFFYGKNKLRGRQLYWSVSIL